MITIKAIAKMPQIVIAIHQPAEISFLVCEV